jgi:parvulin-like peptidyl-prolyl isomerase
LQTGSFKYTVADFELLKSRFKHMPVNTQLENELTDNAYILAYAIENRFDTISFLSKKLMYGTRLYSSEKDGYVWNRKIKPLLTVSSRDIKDVCDKRTTEYTFEAVFFPNATSLTKFLTPGFKIETEKEFDAIKQRVSPTSEINFVNFRGSYPFYPLGIYTDKIFNAKKGDVWGPLETLNGYYVVHVANIESIKQPAYEEKKATIEKELIDGLTEKYIWERRKEVLSKANPKMYDSAITEMASKCIVKKREWPGIDKDMVLMDYKFQGKSHSYSAADFIEFTHCEPIFFGSLTDANDVKEMLKNFLMDIYLFDEAKKMNAETDKEFLLFKKYYQNKLFVQYYYEQHIIPQSEVTAEEVLRHYNENRDNLKKFETAIVSIYKFKDSQSAIGGLGKIMEHYQQNIANSLSKTAIPEKLSSVAENVEIRLSDTTNNLFLINAISNANTGQVLMPLEINGEFWIVYISQKNGNALFPYKYAKVEIERMLSEKRTKKTYDYLLAKLKAKYPLEVNHLKEYNQKMKNKLK